MSHTEPTHGRRTRGDRPPPQRRPDETLDHSEHHRTDDTTAHYSEPHDLHDHHDEARDRFGGTNIGACFFGWLVAMAVAILLTSIVGAVTAAAGATAGVSQTEAERAAGTVGLTAGIVLAVVLLVAYFTGGYVAGRMSRFDGAKQGLGVWVIGLLVTVLAVGVGLVFGSQYNILDRVSLPRIPIPTEQLSIGGIVTALVIVIGTLLAAMLGGKIGHRYHDKVDRVAFG